MPPFLHVVGAIAPTVLLPMPTAMHILHPQVQCCLDKRGVFSFVAQNHVVIQTHNVSLHMIKDVNYDYVQ